MEYRERESVGEYIDRLALAFGSTRFFTDKVKALFVKKGVSLDDNVAPFLSALLRAFGEEQRIRNAKLFGFRTNVPGPIEVQ